MIVLVFDAAVCVWRCAWQRLQQSRRRGSAKPVSGSDRAHGTNQAAHACFVAFRFGCAGGNSAGKERLTARDEASVSVAVGSNAPANGEAGHEKDTELCMPNVPDLSTR